MTPWTIETALPVLRRLEQIVIPHGCHVALGGSVLHVGQSGKDLDVFVYPHNWPTAPKLEPVAKAIAKFLDYKGEVELSPSDDKTVLGMRYNGRRVDVFFLLPSLMPAVP